MCLLTIHIRFKHKAEFTALRSLATSINTAYNSLLPSESSEYLHQYKVLVTP